MLSLRVDVSTPSPASSPPPFRIREGGDGEESASEPDEGAQHEYVTTPRTAAFLARASADTPTAPFLARASADTDTSSIGPSSRPHTNVSLPIWSVSDRGRVGMQDHGHTARLAMAEGPRADAMPRQPDLSLLAMHSTPGARGVLSCALNSLDLSASNGSSSGGVLHSNASRYGGMRGHGSAALDLACAFDFEDWRPWQSSESTCATLGCCFLLRICCSCAVRCCRVLLEPCLARLASGAVPCLACFRRCALLGCFVWLA